MHTLNLNERLKIKRSDARPRGSEVRSFGQWNRDPDSTNPESQWTPNQTTRIQNVDMEVDLRQKRNGFPNDPFRPKKKDP